MYLLQCLLTQQTDIDGPSGVSTSTALYSSAGVCAMWMASICSKEPSGWLLLISSEMGRWCSVPVISRMMLSIMYEYLEMIIPTLSCKKPYHFTRKTAKKPRMVANCSAAQAKGKQSQRNVKTQKST